MDSCRTREFDPVSIRWATWWPVRYWTDRFNHLADRKDVVFEALFLSKKSRLLDLEEDRASYKFRHVFLSQRSDNSGYYSNQIKMRFPRPWPLIRGDLDALIMTYAEPSCIAAAMLSWVLRKPYFLFTGNTKYDDRKSSRLRGWLKRSLLRKATGILVTGPLQRDYVFQYVEDETKISVIGNPVGSLGAERYDSPQVREELRTELGWNGDTILLYVGRLGPEKDLPTLVDAVGRIPHENRPKLVLVGSGPLEAQLRAKASDLEVETQFISFLGPEDLARRYAAADIFVLLSTSEAWGLVVNEAMEFSLPLILSSKVGCAPVLLRDGQNGLIFAAGDSEALAACVHQLSSDENLRRQMGTVSKEIIRDHSLENWADAVLSAVRKSADLRPDADRKG